MKKFIEKIKKQNNQGNSFVVVVATVAFLSILTAALLVAVALIYRLKAYDINSKDNFYYLEQAMDEIYAGVGADSLKILNTAYDDTLESLVYYDVDLKQYVPMTNKQANAMMRKTYMYMLQHDTNYSSDANIYKRLLSFLSNPYDEDKNPEGVQMSFKTHKMNSDDITILDLVLKREANYSTVNARSANEGDGGGDKFIQSVTTDLVIGSPAIEINFDSDAVKLQDLYEYAMIADCGVEITGKDGKSARGNKVSLTGNLYAASDFYNKRYNETPGQIILENGASSSTLTKANVQQVNSYTNAQLKDMDGVNVKSMYSGLYIDGADVVISSDRLIVPGTLAIMNCADVTVSTVSSASDTWASVWADSIVLDGYSLKKNLKGDLQGSSLVMRANVYMYDDLEVNANSAYVKLNGEYYGYNYASTDNRTYSEEALKRVNRDFTNYTNQQYTDGKGIEGQAHYNSSAIILNGENAELDFSLVRSMYVAGQSYIELSKKTEKTEEAMTYTVEATQINDNVEIETDSYIQFDGQNYTNERKHITPIKDYRTGEAISIKSNQLAYIPNTNVSRDVDGNLYVNLPAVVKALPTFSEVWNDLSHVPVIMTKISGKEYYYYDFSQAKQTAAMNEFIASYASLFDEETITSGKDPRTTGEKADLTNITDYDFFQVQALNVVTDRESHSIYTNSAITTKVGTKFDIKASQKNMEALTKGSQKLSDRYANSGSNSAGLTQAFNEQYKEVKWLLTNDSSDNDFIAEAHALKESCITPINHFFDFSLVNSDNTRYCALASGYGVWVCDGDVKIGEKGYTFGKKTFKYDKPFKRGRVRGVVICKGDVTFDDDVEGFDGLIVSGGKIIINNFTAGKNEMALTANAEILRSVLRECDASRGNSDESENFGFVCDIFTQFVSQYEEPEGSDENELVPMKNISSVQIEDIITIKNWVKNVD